MGEIAVALGSKVGIREAWSKVLVFAISPFCLFPPSILTGRYGRR